MSSMNNNMKKSADINVAKLVDNRQEGSAAAALALLETASLNLDWLSVSILNF